MKDFIKQLKKDHGHILQIIKTAQGKDMIFYRTCGSYYTDVKIIVF
jgi:hypothetical protein